MVARFLLVERQGPSLSPHVIFLLLFSLFGLLVFDFIYSGNCDRYLLGRTTAAVFAISLPHVSGC